MKVVFLDFYGVVSGALVEGLCERTGAVIVISSDAVKQWVPGEHDFERAKKMLVDIGIREDRVVGFTIQNAESNTMYDRPREIRAWLAEHPEVTHYVIFDDKPLPYTAERIEKLRADLEKTAKHIEDSGRGLLWAREYLGRLVEPDPEGAARFVLVDGRLHLTESDIERGYAILERL